MLATVALLGLALSLCMAGIGGALDAAAHREAIAIARDAEARARLAARGAGPVRILVVDEGRAVEVRTLAGGERLLRRDMPPGFVAQLAGIDGAPLPAIEVDALGRSGDHAILLAGPRGASRIDVAGLTGLLVETRP